VSGGESAHGTNFGHVPAQMGFDPRDEHLGGHVTVGTSPAEAENGGRAGELEFNELDAVRAIAEQRTKVLDRRAQARLDDRGIVRSGTVEHSHVAN
jgi:hypothetical protein